MQTEKKIFLASDLHLGVPDTANSLEREKKFVRWLDVVAPQAAEIIILGDVFDFWFEYKTAVPKGFVRILGKLAEVADAGVPVTVFAGNHDLWYKDYFPRELGIAVAHGPVTRTFFGKKFYLAHGDGLGPGDRTYKFTKWVFLNPFFNWLFQFFHPNIGIGLANFFSRRSARKSRVHDAVDYGDKEMLFQYVQSFIQIDDSFDYFVFGHRHMMKRVPMRTPGGKEVEMIYLGEWITLFSYAEIGPQGIVLKQFED